MVRKIRFKQVLRERIGNSGGLYKSQVSLQRSFWKEDQAHAWTIPQVREIHSHPAVCTWDKLVSWVRWETSEGEIHNTIYIRSGKWVQTLKPKADYRRLKESKLKRWKEQEKRTLEFFEREGC